MVVGEKKDLDAVLFFFSSSRRHTRLTCDWSSDVCSSDLVIGADEHRKYYTRQALVELLTSHGFRIEQERAISLHAKGGSMERLAIRAFKRTHPKIGRASCREGGMNAVVDVKLATGEEVGF